MLKQIVAIFCAVSLFASCTPVDTVELDSLRAENAVLRAKIDSLETSAIAQRIVISSPSGKKSKKKRKQAVGLAAIPQTSSAPQPVYKSAPTARVSYSSQCQAITKKGYQCSRKARSGGYCWQHGG